MAVFKKLFSLLFEETDAEVIAEDELETIEFKEKKKVKNESVKEQVYQPVREEPVYQAAREQTQEEKKRFVSIDLEENKPAEVKKEVKASKEPMQRTALKKNDPKDFEFTPVISPMFGAKEEKKKEDKRKQGVQILKKSGTVKKKPNPLGTIISPYFGVNELEEFEEEAKEEIAIKEQIKATPVELPQDEMELEQLDQMEEVANVTLDELLEDDIPSDNAEDLMQISLFGESTPVQEVEETYKVKDNE